MANKIWLSALVATLVAAPVTADPPPVELSFDSSGITAPVSPGASALLFGIAKEKETWMHRLVPWLEVGDDTDQDGSVYFDLAGGPAVSSVWAVVDLEDGSFELGVPSDDRPHEVALAAGGWQSSRSADVIRDARHQLEVLVVRPGVGAWHGRAVDGGPDDDDGLGDGWTGLSLPSLQPVYGGLAVLYHLDAGDVVIGIDPRKLEIFTLEVTP